MKDSVLQDRIKGNWKQLSGSVRQEWGKLTHNDVERIKGDVEILTGLIQERYGVAKAEAKKQIETWSAKFTARQAEQKQSQAEQSKTTES